MSPERSLNIKSTTRDLILVWILEKGEHDRDHLQCLWSHFYVQVTASQHKYPARPLCQSPNDVPSLTSRTINCPNFNFSGFEGEKRRPGEDHNKALGPDKSRNGAHERL